MAQFFVVVPGAKFGYFLDVYFPSYVVDNVKRIIWVSKSFIDRSQVVISF